jgi:hypothetical protein
VLKFKRKFRRQTVNTKSRDLAEYLILEALERMIARLRIDSVALLLLSEEEND